MRPLRNNTNIRRRPILQIRKLQRKCGSHNITKCRYYTWRRFCRLRRLSLLYQRAPVCIILATALHFFAQFFNLTDELKLERNLSGVTIFWADVLLFPILRHKGRNYSFIYTSKSLVVVFIVRSQNKLVLYYVYSASYSLK